MFDFKALNQQLDIRAVARDYGLTPDRTGKVHCPFHNERTASMQLYKDSFYCFGCGESGDSISLVAQIEGISQIKAFKELNERYSLGISADRGKALTQKKKVSLKCVGWRTEALDVLAWFCRVCGKVIFRTNVSDITKEAYRYELEKVEELHQMILELPPLESYERFRKEVSAYEQLHAEFKNRQFFNV